MEATFMNENGKFWSVANRRIKMFWLYLVRIFFFYVVKFLSSEFATLELLQTAFNNSNVKNSFPKSGKEQRPQFRKKKSLDWRDFSRLESLPPLCNDCSRECYLCGKAGKNPLSMKIENALHCSDRFQQKKVLKRDRNPWRCCSTKCFARSLLGSIVPIIFGKLLLICKLNMG